LKLCQKGKLFLMFPNISMQNLLNFQQRESHHFGFQSLEIENLGNSKWSRGPLVSERHRLTARSGRQCTCATADGDHTPRGLAGLIPHVGTAEEGLSHFSSSPSLTLDRLYSTARRTATPECLSTRAAGVPSLLGLSRGSYPRCLLHVEVAAQS
jgi:hypothetical protein